MKTNVNKITRISSINIEFDTKEIQMMQWVLNNYKDVAKLITEKEKLLEPGIYPLRDMLKKLKKIFNTKDDYTKKDKMYKFTTTDTKGTKTTSTIPVSTKAEADETARILQKSKGIVKVAYFRIS